MRFSTSAALVSALLFGAVTYAQEIPTLEPVQQFQPVSDIPDLEEDQLIIGYGNVFIYQLDVSHQWTLEAELPISESFGAVSVAIDQDYAMAEAVDFTNCHVNVYHRAAGTWSVVQTLSECPGWMDLKGKFAAFTVGDGVHVYRRAANGTFVADGNLVAPPGTLFGSSVLVHRGEIIVGASQEGEERGAVYVFDRTNGAWHEAQRLLAGDGSPHDLFGEMLDAKGDELLVGANNEGHAQHDQDQTAHLGAAYVFRNEQGTWVEQQKLTVPHMHLWRTDFLYGQRIAIAAAPSAGPGDFYQTFFVGRLDASNPDGWRPVAQLSPQCSQCLSVSDGTSTVMKDFSTGQGWEYDVSREAIRDAR